MKFSGIKGVFRSPRMKKSSGRPNYFKVKRSSIGDFDAGRMIAAVSSPSLIGRSQPGEPDTNTVLRILNMQFDSLKLEMKKQTELLEKILAALSSEDSKNDSDSS